MNDNDLKNAVRDRTRDAMPDLDELRLDIQNRRGTLPSRRARRQFALRSRPIALMAAAAVAVVVIIAGATVAFRSTQQSVPAAQPSTSISRASLVGTWILTSMSVGGRSVTIPPRSVGPLVLHDEGVIVSGGICGSSTGQWAIEGQTLTTRDMTTPGNGCDYTPSPTDAELRQMQELQDTLNRLWPGPVQIIGADGDSLTLSTADVVATYERQPSQSRQTSNPPKSS